MKISTDNYEKEMQKSIDWYYRKMKNQGIDFKQTKLRDLMIKRWIEKKIKNLDSVAPC